MQRMFVSASLYLKQRRESNRRYFWTRFEYEWKGKYLQLFLELCFWKQLLRRKAMQPGSYFSKAKDKLFRSFWHCVCSRRTDAQGPSQHTLARERTNFVCWYYRLIFKMKSKSNSLSPVNSAIWYRKLAFPLFNITFVSGLYKYQLLKRV